MFDCLEGEKISFEYCDNLLFKLNKCCVTLICNYMTHASELNFVTMKQYEMIVTVILTNTTCLWIYILVGSETINQILGLGLYEHSYIRYDG